MARQLIGTELNITLPEYTDRLVERLPTGECISESFTVTVSRVVTIKKIEVEKRFLGVSVDVYGEVGGVSFVVYFTHPGREVPPALTNVETENCGIISISLERLSEMFNIERADGTSYQSTLKKYLSNDVLSKRWIFHPRYKSCKENALVLLKRNIAATGGMVNPQNTNSFVIFQCGMCHTTWEGHEQSASACPECKTHLFRSVKQRD